ncbi:MAG: hypothetical protein FJ102_01930 [Deltaproteobacteria bacterium]|nr:hypothetical protein [Deltaproteobacteria bacterium]
MIPLLLLGCGSVFDGSYLVEYVITLADEEIGLLPGDKVQAVADLMTAGGGAAIVDVDGTVYEGTLASYLLDVDQWESVAARDGDCAVEIVTFTTISASFTSYDTFDGDLDYEQSISSAGCGLDDESYRFAAELAGVRILRGSQVDDAVRPLYE